MKYRNVVDRIISEQGISQEEFATELGYQSSYISKLRNGKVPISKDVKEKILETYPMYRENEQGEVRDEAQILYGYFKKIFQEICATPKNKNKHEKYLRLKMNKNLYDFFVKTALVKELKEQGSQCFEEEFIKCKKQYLASPKEYQDYILLPCNALFEIIEEDKRKRKSLEECLNLSEDIEDYIDVSEDIKK